MRREIIYSALGLGVGTIVGWAITADIYEKKWKEERAGYDYLLKNKTDHIWALQDRLEAINNAILNKHAPPEENAEGPLEEEPEVEQPTLEFEESNEIPEGETVETTKSNLQSLIEMYTADPEAQAEFAEVTSTVVSQESNNSQPFVISREQYAYDDEGQYYSKITLKYYPRDRVVLDDEEEPIDNIPGYIGWRNLSRFGDESGDPEVVFVRNRNLETDFEIIKEEESPLPLHVTYGMEREEFRANRAAGLIKLRQEDE